FVLCTLFFERASSPRTKNKEQSTKYKVQRTKNKQSFMYRYIWLVPLLPLVGAAVNGFFGRRFRFSEQLIGGIAVGSVALAFLISVAAVISYGFGSHAQWPNAYVTSQAGAFKFDWVPGGAVLQTQGDEARLSAELDKKAEQKRAQMTPEERAQ